MDKKKVIIFGSIVIFIVLLLIIIFISSNSASQSDLDPNFSDNNPSDQEQEISSDIEVIIGLADNEHGLNQITVYSDAFKNNKLLPRYQCRINDIVPIDVTNYSDKYYASILLVNVVSQTIDYQLLNRKGDQDFDLSPSDLGPFSTPCAQDGNQYELVLVKHEQPLDYPINSLELFTDSQLATYQFSL